MKPLARYEQRYAVCPSGHILNKANNSYLQPILNPNGYFKVGLANGSGSHEQLLIHRLVALHFIPNPYEHTQVNHKDGNKTNNAVSNLEWVSPSENVQHALATGLRAGYMSADDKEAYLRRVLAGEQVKDIAKSIGRSTETLHKMLRDTAKRLNQLPQWTLIMKENRKNAALRNLAAINTKHS